MDKVTDTPHTRLIGDTSEHSNSSAEEGEDAVPLSDLLKKMKENSEKQTFQSQQKANTGCGENARKDKNALDSSDDEDDVPLVNLQKKPIDKASEKTAVLDTSDDDDDEDDVPLVNLLRKSNHEKASENRAVLDSSDDDDDDEDDVPLANLLKKLQGDKPSEKTADKNDSSDDEPLTKYTKPRPAKKTEENQKKSNSNPRSKRTTGAVEDTSSSDDEPLSEVSKRLLARQQTKSRRKPKAVRKCNVSSSDDSDDEPLVKRSQKTEASSRSKNTQPPRHKPKDTLSSDGSSEDDLPLANLARKWDQTTTKTTTTTTLGKRSAPRPTARVKKTQAVAAESSDDEPLLKLLKRPLKDATNTRLPQGKGAMSAKKKRGKTPTKTDKGPPGRAAIAKKNKRLSAYGSSGDSSDDEPLIKIAKNPHLTKFLTVMVERCSVEGHVELHSTRQPQHV